MGKININYQNGGIGGIIASNDGVSGLIYDTTILPADYEAGSTVELFGIRDAENIGITNDGVTEVTATGGAVTITAVGDVGEVVSVIISPKNADPIVIGSYSIKTGDTNDDIAEGLSDSINLKQIFTSTVATNVVSLIAPEGYGASISGVGIINCVSNDSGSDLAVTISNFTGGVGCKLANLHYIIDSFFKSNPETKLFLKLVNFTSAFDAEEIAKIQTAANGEIRQVGIWTKKGLNNINNIVTTCNAVAVNQASKKKPLSVVIAAQPGSATLATLSNLRTLQSPRVSVTISNELGSNSRGYNLIGITGNYPTDLGSVLGHISRSSVAHSIAWVAENVTQLPNVMLVTGEAWNEIEDTTRPDELAQKGYIFERKYFGYAGSYFDNDSVADAFTSDYDSIKRMRTMDKVARISYFSLVPYLSSPLVLDSTTGQMSTSTVIKFTSVLNQQIQQMATDAEVSGFSVYINPAQNVLVNKELVVNVSIVPVGSADTITLNLGYVLQIQ